MLEVSGVGENKYLKYGQRFIDEITAFLTENPQTVTSIETDEDGDDVPQKKQNLRRGGRKEPFYLYPEDAEKFVYAEYYYISDIKDRLNEICSAEGVKRSPLL